MKNSKPKEKTNPTEVPELIYQEKDPFELALNQRVVLQSRSHGVIYKGFLAEVLPRRYLLLTDAIVLGRNFKVETPWLIVEPSIVNHIHPDGLPLKDREKK